MPSIPSPNQPGYKFAIAFGLFLMASSLYGIAEVYDIVAPIQGVLEDDGITLDELRGADAVRYAKAKWMYKLSFFGTVIGYFTAGAGTVWWIGAPSN